MNAELYVYNDGLHHGGRRPRLWLAKGDVARKFTGDDVPGFAVVASHAFTAKGKWSNTTYRLLLAPGVRPVYMLSPLHGIWGQDLLCWGEAADELGVSESLARHIVAAEYPDTAARLDRVEAEFARQAELEPEPEVVFIHFGRPSNRMMREGFWDEPKSRETSDGRVVTVVKDAEKGWYNPRAIEPEGAEVVGVKHIRGPHGGWFEVQVLVPPAGGNPR